MKRFNDFTYEYFLHEDVCRLCWNRSAFKVIMDTEINDNCTKLVDQIKYCLDLEVNNSKGNYPRNICLRCSDQIEQFYVYKTECRGNDIRLRDIFQEAEQNKLNESVFLTKNTHINNFMNESANDGEVHVSSYKIESGATQINPLLYENDDVHNTLQFSDAGSTCEPPTKPRKRRAKAESKIKRATYCSICKIDLGCQNKLHIHNAELHSIENSWYKCYGCEKKFKSAKRRQSHEQTFCKYLKDGYRCAECLRCLPSRKMFERHIRDHSNKVLAELPEDIFMCRKCNKTFKTKEKLSGHEVIHSTQKKKFICENCGRVFKRQDYLHKHQLTHTGTKQHVCPHCGLRFTQKSSLTIHIRKHTGERPYSCDVCPQRCISSSNLRAHRRRHLGIKKFECIICNRKFGYKISLDEHVASTHAQPQTYPCQYCGATYTRPRGLRRHLLAKHKEKQEKPADPSCLFQKVTDISTSVEERNLDNDYDLMVVKNQEGDAFVVH